MTILVVLIDLAEAEKQAQVLADQHDTALSAEIPMGSSLATNSCTNIMDSAVRRGPWWFSRETLEEQLERANLP